MTRIRKSLWCLVGSPAVPAVSWEVTAAFTFISEHAEFQILQPFHSTVPHDLLQTLATFIKIHGCFHRAYTTFKNIYSNEIHEQVNIH